MASRFFIRWVSRQVRQAWRYLDANEVEEVAEKICKTYETSWSGRRDIPRGDPGYGLGDVSKMPLDFDRQLTVFNIVYRLGLDEKILRKAQAAELSQPKLRG